MNAAEKDTNCFGFLRLLFASLVILCHSSELIYGDRSHELLTSLFHTMTFGEVGVDGFFLVSGYLITKSVMSSNYFDYLMKRVFRIYPGFIVAFLISAFVVAPIGGAALAEIFSSHDVVQSVLRIVTLKQPLRIETFAGTPYPVVNGALWTISYEAMCYIMILVMLLIGLLRRRTILLAVTALAMAASIVMSALNIKYGHSDLFLRFMPVFLVGSLFYLYQDVVKYVPAMLLVTIPALITLMFIKPIAEPAFVILGGYIIFYVAFTVREPNITAIGSKLDLSYGVYLYGWPIQKLLTWYFPKIGIAELLAASLVPAFGCAYLSWVLVEKPAKSLLNKPALRRITSSSPSSWNELKTSLMQSVRSLAPRKLAAMSGKITSDSLDG